MINSLIAGGVFWFGALVMLIFRIFAPKDDRQGTGIGILLFLFMGILFFAMGMRIQSGMGLCIFP